MPSWGKGKMDKIILPDMEFWGRHGLSGEERANPQPFFVTVELWLPLEKAATEDDIFYTVDYSQIYLQIKDLVENSSCHLIETLADKIAQIAMAYELVQKVCVSVEKSRARVEDYCFCARVVLERSR